MPRWQITQRMMAASTLFCWYKTLDLYTPVPGYRLLRITHPPNNNNKEADMITDAVLGKTTIFVTQGH